jgi:putative transcriptional regulator
MNFHPEHQWLEQFAAGTLPLPLSLCISAHVCFCPTCRQQVEQYQMIGAQLMTDFTQASTVDDDVFSKLMSTIDNAPVVHTPKIEQPTLHEGVPKVLRKLIPNGFDQLKWNWQLPALKVADLGLSDENYQVALHRIKAGGRVYEHDHQGNEFTLVLQGSFSDDFGCYSDGDFILRQPHELHSPLAAQNEECICLTIQEAPVKFTGLFTQVLNPLLRQ